MKCNNAIYAGQVPDSVKWCITSVRIPASARENDMLPMIRRLLFVLMLAAAPLPGRAADYYWNPAAPSGNWAFNSNWSIGAPGTYTSQWSDSNTAIFTGANQTVTVNTFISVAGLNFNANGITLVSGSGSSDLRLIASVPVSVSGANTATISTSLTSIGAGSVLLKQGTGTLVTGGSNTITTINIAEGTLRLAGNSALGSISTNPGLVIAGTLDLAGFSGSRGSLTGAGTITNSALATFSTLTVGGPSGSATYTGTIQNGAGVVALGKAGAGDQVLSGGTLSYTGVTTVSAGRLFINGTKSGGGAVNVLSGAALGGAGTIAGPITLTSATLEVGGTGIGTLAVNSIAATGSTARFHFNRTAGDSPGVGYDRLDATGTIDLTGLTLDAVVNNGGTNTFATMTILNAAPGNLTGTFTGLAHGDAVPALNGFAGTPTWYIRYDYAAGDVQLSAVPVPEPAAGGLFAAGLLLAKRRRSLRQ